ncbi:MAG TPA: hypothetical protein VI585_08190, partial [Candidatus Binatia bacterium]
LFGAVHLARAARSQNDSGLFASLGNWESSHPERQKQHRIPPAAYISMREDDRQDDAHGEHGDTHEQALTGLLRPDIGEFCFSDVHRKLPVLLFIC